MDNFIVKNEKITNKEIIRADKNKLIDLTFIFDSTFADADKFVLRANGIENKLYSFSNDGFLRFKTVNFGMLNNGDNQIEIQIIKNNTENICIDSITINFTSSAGGGTSSKYQLPLATTQQQLVALWDNTNSKWILSNVSAEKIETKSKTINVQANSNYSFEMEYLINEQYDISPLDKFSFCFSGLNSNTEKSKSVKWQAELYLDDVLIRKGREDRDNPNTWIASGGNIIVITLNEVFHKEMLENNIGKSLKLKITCENKKDSAYSFYIRSNQALLRDQTGYTGFNTNCQTGLFKNYDLITFNNFVYFYGMRNQIRLETSNYVDQLNIHFYSYRSRYEVPASGRYSANIGCSGQLYFPKTSENIGKIKHLDLSIDLSDDQFLGKSQFIFMTDSTFTYSINIDVGGQWIWDQDMGQDIFYPNEMQLNHVYYKPFDFKPNKCYIIQAQHGRYITWWQLDKYNN